MIFWYFFLGVFVLWFIGMLAPLLELIARIGLLILTIAVIIFVGYLADAAFRG